MSSLSSASDASGIRIPSSRSNKRSHGPFHDLPIDRLKEAMENLQGSTFKRSSIQIEPGTASKF